MSTYYINQREYNTTPGAPAATTEQLVALLDRISEHLGCFIVYAYDFNGNPLKVGVQTSHMEDSALRAFIKSDALGEIDLVPQPLGFGDEFETLEADWEDDDEDYDPED